MEKTAKVFIDIKIRVYNFFGDMVFKVQSISQVSQSVSQSVSHPVPHPVSRSVNNLVSQSVI